VRLTLERFGRLDVLVNNAAFQGRQVERFEDLDGRICAALGERPHGPPTGDQLSIAEAAGRLLIGPP
jgi:NAD(P)-dependent dehydrogenase (short-subunit alcohol dehydrogenase family)